MPDTTTTQGKLLLSAQELAGLLGVGRSTIWTWHSSGRIPMPLKVGGCTRWRRVEIQRWVESGCPGRGRWEMLKGEAKGGER